MDRAIVDLGTLTKQPTPVEGIDTRCRSQRMYCLGLGVDVDLEKGYELYYDGYLMGDPLACANLGYCYENGQGVEKDLEQAIVYYEIGAEDGEEHCVEALERLKG